jgi:acetyl esterase/lipase
MLAQVCRQTATLLMAALLLVGASAACAAGGDFRAKTQAVEMTPDIKFGDGGIEFAQGAGAPRSRDLLVDVYAPADDASGPRPALILAFGGAHQRGSRKNDFVAENGQSNTSIAEYCR